MDSNKQLVEYLKSGDWIETEEVAKAFLKADRKRFVPEESAERAYNDAPIRLAKGSTISAPHIVGRITELAEVVHDSKVLEVGSGSGYQLCILSFLADEVTGIEPVKDLVERSRETLSDRENIEITHGTAPEDVEEKYDRIIISYAADLRSWNLLKNKLNEGGIMVGAVETNGDQRLRKYRNGKEEILERVRFVRSR